MPHLHKHIDFTVALYIVWGKQVLLVHHKKLKKWLPIGGHIELDENPEEALFREAKEECGLKIQLAGSIKPRLQFSGHRFLYLPVYLDIHEITPEHQHIGLVYFAKASSSKVKLNKKEHNDIRWFSLYDLEGNRSEMPENVFFYARDAICKLGPVRIYRRQPQVVSTKLSTKDWLRINSLPWTPKFKRIIDVFRKKRNKDVVVRELGLACYSSIQTVNTLMSKHGLPYSIRKMGDYAAHWENETLHLYVVDRK